MDADACDFDDDVDVKVNPVMKKEFCHLMTGLMHHNGPRGLLARTGRVKKPSNFKSLISPND